MIICSCNVLSDRCIDGAIKGGARRTSEVYAGLGCAPQCGRCARTIRERIRDAGDTAPLLQHYPARSRTVAITPSAEPQEPLAPNIARPRLLAAE